MSTDVREAPVAAPRERVRAALRSEARPAQALRFGLHVVEMAVAMELGMLPLGPLLGAVGQADLSSRAPEIYTVVMNAAMAAAMAAWMLARRHGRRLVVEMSAAMTVPGGVVAAAGLAGLVPHEATVTAMGVLMWVGMIAAMAYRWPAYARHCPARADA